MNLLRKIASLVRGEREPTPSGEWRGVPRREDYGQVLLGDLTPTRVSAMLRSAAQGDPGMLSVLYDEMLARDEDLLNAYRTRLAALGGLEWEIVGADQIANRSGRISAEAARPAAEYCRAVLEDLADWDVALRHLAEAIGRGVSVIELRWERRGGALAPVEARGVLHSQLHYDAIEPERLRISTPADWTGIALDEMPAGQFLVHCPTPLAGNGFRGALLLTAATGYLEKRWGRRWEMVFLELFGMPVLTAQYAPSATQAEKDAMLAMIRDQGVARGGVFPQGSAVELHESSTAAGGGLPHEVVIGRVNAGYAKLFLGQTLTTEIGQTGGARAAAEVHDRVRRDLLDEDIRAEGRVIREQLLRPLVRAKFGANAPAPYFRRVVEESRDTAIDLANVSVAVNDLGLAVPQSYVAELAGIPLVDGADPAAPIPGRAAAPDPFAPHRAKTGATSLLANSKLDEIARRRSSAGRLAAWIAAAVLASQAHSEAVVAAAGAAIADVRGAEEAGAALANAFVGLPTADMTELQRQFLVAARLAGRGRVDQRLKTGAGHRLKTGAAEWRAHAEQIDFAKLPFVEAIDALRERLGLTPEEFIALDTEARSRAFRVAGVWNMDLLSAIHEALVATLESGGTARDFRTRTAGTGDSPAATLPELADREGWTGPNPWHAEIVHYQNFAMASAAGRYEQYREADIGHWKFVSWGETCEICRPFIGRVFRLDDRRAWPPLHFWCDCEDEVVFDAELRGQAVSESASIDAPRLEEERAKAGGFKFDPAHYARLEPLRLSRFPAALRPAFEAFGRAQGWEIES